MTDQLPGSAYAYFREKILGGELRPGSWLKEQEVAAQLGISRTPVREAIARLELEGFVNRSPRRGAIVCQLELDEIDEIYEIRAALEHLVAKRACRRASRGRDRCDGARTTHRSALRGGWRYRHLAPAHRSVPHFA